MKIENYAWDCSFCGANALYRAFGRIYYCPTCAVVKGIFNNNPHYLKETRVRSDRRRNTLIGKTVDGKLVIYSP